MTPEQEEHLRIASRLGDTSVHLASVVLEIAEQMIKYCDDHNIKIDFFERKQWNMLIKSARALDSMILDQDKQRRIIYRRNIKMFSVFMRLVLARVDDDDLKLYKWYNYIKSFPADLPEIQPTGDEELEAFKHILIS